jgi:hypothetical protein
MTDLLFTASGIAIYPVTFCFFLLFLVFPGLHSPVLAAPPGLDPKKPQASTRSGSRLLVILAESKGEIFHWLFHAGQNSLPDSRKPPPEKTSSKLTDTSSQLTDPTSSLTLTPS